MIVIARLFLNMSEMAEEGELDVSGAEVIGTPEELLACAAALINAALPCILESDNVIGVTLPCKCAELSVVELKTNGDRHVIELKME